MQHCTSFCDIYTVWQRVSPDMHMFYTFKLSKDLTHKVIEHEGSKMFRETKHPT